MLPIAWNYSVFIKKRVVQNISFHLFDKTIYRIAVIHFKNSK